MKNTFRYGVVSNKSNNFMTLLERITDSCDFLVLFSSILFINNDTYFDINKLINFIDECQQKNKYLNLLNNIYIRDDKYDSFYKAIKVLKMDKDITEIKCQHRNTQYYDHIMLISKNINLKEELTRNNKEKIIEMTDFINDYYNYLNRDIHIDYKTSSCHVRRLSLN